PARSTFRGSLPPPWAFRYRPNDRWRDGIQALLFLFFRGGELGARRALQPPSTMSSCRVRDGRGLRAHKAEEGRESSTGTPREGESMKTKRCIALSLVVGLILSMV